MTFPKWYTTTNDDDSEVEVRPHPTRVVPNIALGALAVASIFMVVSILWQHVSSAAAASMGRSLAYGTVESHVGSAAMALGWSGVSLILLATVGLIVSMLTIRILQNVLDDVGDGGSSNS
jgi:hypothetical protein